MLFLRNLGSIHNSYIKRGKAGDCVQSQLTNLSSIKEPRTDSPWKRQILKARSFSYLLPSSRVLRCVFCGQMFLTLLVLGYLTSAQEPRWLRNAWWARTWTQGMRVINITWKNMTKASDSLLIARERLGIIQMDERIIIKCLRPTPGFLWPTLKCDRSREFTLLMLWSYTNSLNYIFLPIRHPSE